MGQGRERGSRPHLPASPSSGEVQIKGQRDVKIVASTLPRRSPFHLLSDRETCPEEPWGDVGKHFGVLFREGEGCEDFLMILFF